MDFIFSTGSLYTYSIERCFDLAAQAGFDGIELMLDHRWDTRQPHHVQRLIEQYRQPVIAVHSPFSHRVPGWPDDEPARIQASVKLAEAIGAKVVVHHLPPRLGWFWLRIGSRRFPVPTLTQVPAKAYQKWLQQTYQTFQATTEILLCIENMPARRWLGRQWNAHRWNSVAEIVRFPTLTLDTTHLGTWGIDPIEIYPQLQGSVRHVHLSNFDGREHRRPEHGHLSLNRLLAHMAETGYQGAISLELHPDALEAGSRDERIAALLRNSLCICRGWVETKDFE